MKPRELFTVLIKAMGVWEFVVGLTSLPNGIATFSGYGQTDNHWEVFNYVLSVMVVYPIARILAGVALFMGADWLARRAFPTPPADPE